MDEVLLKEAQRMVCTLTTRPPRPCRLQLWDREDGRAEGVTLAYILLWMCSSWVDVIITVRARFYLHWIASKIRIVFSHQVSPTEIIFYFLFRMKCMCLKTGARGSYLCRLEDKLMFAIVSSYLSLQLQQFGYLFINLQDTQTRTHVNEKLE